MSRRRRTGRVRLNFTVIERFAALALEDLKFAALVRDMELQKTSSLHRRKDGSYTLVLNWKSAGGLRISSTYRGLRLERGA